MKEWKDVAPHAGAWIEISKAGTRTLKTVVAPHAGAWIEMRNQKGS